MFVVLSHVIETLTGQRLEDAFLTGLWKPPGMLDTYLSLQDALSKSWHVARGYAWDKDWEQYVPLDWMPTEEVSGSGAVIMSGPDMARWLRFWIREQKPLTPEAHRNIRPPRIVIQGEDPSPYDTPLMCAQAWNTSSYRGHRFWTKHGGTDAFGALITFFPELDFGIALMGNTAYTANAVAEILTWPLVDNKLDVSPKERFDWTKR
jgi:CubicO group peptidase (beta-lactamase class C family)